MIKVWDYKDEYKILRKNILKSIDDVFKSGTLVFGPALDKFEKKFTQFIGTKYGLGVGNGTDALGIWQHWSRKRSLSRSLMQQNRK